MRSCLPGFLILFLTFLVGGGAVLSAQQAGAPLTEREITYLLEKKVSSSALAEMVQSYGVAFQADDSIFLRLRKAGASEALLETIRKQAKSRELRIEVIKPEPPPPELEPEPVPAPAREHLQLGQQKLKSYDYEGALREFAEAERILPQWDQIFQQRGLAFEALGRYSDAASEWKLYLSLAPANVNKAGVEQQIAKWEGEASRVNNTRLLLNQGNQQLQRGDTKGAAQSFRAAVALGNSVGTLLALARAQLLDGDYAGVEETARQAQMFDPQSALAARYLADAKVRQAKSGSPVVDRGVKSDPGSREARNNLGQAPSGQADAAVAEFRDLIKLNPNSADAHYNLANALASKGDLDSAIASYRESLRLRPESVQAHNNLANALRSQRKFDEALSEYREAIRLSPPQAYLHFNLANALADAGKFKEAIEQYGFALKLDPDDPETHNNLAVAQAAAGNLDKAADEYRQALRLSPGFARAHYNLGLLLERQGNRSAAVSEFSEAIRAQPDYAAAHFSLGQTLERTGKLQDALAHLRTSWELNPQNVNSLSEYERLLKAAMQSAAPPAPVN